MPDDVKLIQIEMDVGHETITATYVDPEKIAGMLAEEKSLGGFLRELRDTTPDEPVEEPAPEMPAHPMTERELELVNGFEALIEKANMTPDEVRAMICGVVAGFAIKAGIDMEDLHDDIDAAYDYKVAHQGRPS